MTETEIQAALDRASDLLDSGYMTRKGVGKVVDDLETAVAEVKRLGAEVRRLNKYVEDLLSDGVARENDLAAVRARVAALESQAVVGKAMQHFNAELAAVECSESTDLRAQIAIAVEALEELSGRGPQPLRQVASAALARLRGGA